MLRTYLLYNTVVPEKKVLVICLAGARSLLRPEKKVLVVCLAGVRSLLRPEKSFSRLSGGCMIVITTGKKAVWRVRDVSNLNVTNLY